MDRAKTIDTVTELLGEDLANLSEDGWDRVLARSVIPDDAGRYPDATGYTPNYDPDWAAAEVVAEALQRAMTGERVLEWSSEGTRMKVLPADLAGLETLLRDRSVVRKAQQDTMDRLQIPGTLPNYAPRSGSAGRFGVITNAD